jgi:predicted PurR-regulated permease PerM
MSGVSLLTADFADHGFMNTPPVSHPETRRGTSYILIAISLVCLAVIIWRISAVITTIFGGIIGAAGLRGLAHPLARRSGLSPRFSLWLVLVGLFGCFGAIAWLFGNQVAAQASEMERLIPEAMHRISDALDHSIAGRALVLMIREAAIDSKTLASVGLVASGALLGLAQILSVFFLSAYFAFNPLEYVDGFLQLLPPAHRPRVKIALFKAGDALRQWLLAQLIAMIIVGILIGSISGLLGVPLALLLGTLAALLEFIPVVGAILFIVAGVLVAFTKGSAIALYMFFVCLGVQQLEGSLIIPLLQRWAVRLPPAIAIISVAMGGILLGIPGIIFATPIAVVTMALVKALYIEEDLEYPRGSSRPTSLAIRGRQVHH